MTTATPSRLVGLALSLVLPGSLVPARAQSDEDLANELLALLNTKVTVASKSAESTREAPASIVVVSRLELEGFAAKNLGQVMNRVVGMAFVTADFNLDQSVVVRGEDTTPYNNHILILLNGRPVRDPGTGGNNRSIWGGFPLSAIERLEIIRGPGSVLYGSCAYAGVVNIVTRSGKHQGVEGVVSLNGGSYGGFGQEAMATLNLGELGGMVAFSQFGDKGPRYSFYDYLGQYGTAKFDRHTLAGVVNLRYKGFSLNAQTSTFDSYSLNGGAKTWDPTFKNEVQLTTLDMSYETALSSSVDLGLSLTSNHSRWFTESRANPIELNARALLYEAILKVRPLDGMNILVGGGGEKADWNESPVIAASSQKSHFVYAQMDYRIQSVKLVGGVQYNKIEDLGGHSSPRLGIIYDLNAHSGFKALYSEAYRKGYPLETAFRHPVIHGNPALRPELITTTELQYFYQGEAFSGTVTYFQSHLTDVVIRNRYPVTDPPPGLPPYYLQYVNAGKSDYSGLEAEGNLSVTHRLMLTGSVSYQTNKNQDGVKEAALHPSVLAKLGVLYRSGNWSFSLFDAYSSKPHSVAIVNPSMRPLNKEPEAVHLLSAKCSWTAWTEGKASVAVALEGDNLLDSDVRYPDFTSKGVNSLQPLSAGASFTGRVTVKF